MLFLLSIVLVLAATALLVLGLLASDGLGLFYASIGMTAVAFVLLVIVARRSRPAVETTLPEHP
jgi:Na+/proline symporter